MTVGYISLSISYVVIICFCIWMLARENIGIAKVAAVPFLIWYVVFLHLSSDTMLGYPTRSPMPDKTVIVGMRIVEPQQGNAGGMYFWGVPYEKILDATQIPRSYSMPYDRERHKQLMQAKGSGKNNIIMWGRGEEGGIVDMLGRGRNKSKRGKFQVLNPEVLLTKDD